MKDYRQYHKYDIKSKIKNDALFILQRTLDGYAGYDVLINDNKNVKVLIYQKYDSDGEGYKIVGYPEDIERGNLVLYDSENYLMITKPEDNRVYRKTEMRLCTTFFPLVTPGKEIFLGYDDLKRPVFDYEEGITVNIPCVVKFNDASTSVADVNKPINLLDGQVKVTIPYRESSSIEYNERFKLYKDVYRIIRIDPSDSINGVGVLHITGERVESTGDQ